MKLYSGENLAYNLPDSYAKDAKSNNSKILEIERSEVEKIRTTLREIDAILDLENAYGKTLDLYGARVGQARGQATDDQYRVLIKAKIVRNLSNGSIPSFIESICATFSCAPTEIVISEMADTCALKIDSLPLSAITKAGFSTSQTVAIIESLLPVGARLDSFLFNGTFEFAASEGVYTEGKGFTDVEGGEGGGYFGAINGDENDIILPI